MSFSISNLLTSSNQSKDAPESVPEESGDEIDEQPEAEKSGSC